MHEDYLQQIWSQSRIPSPKLRLLDGTPVIIRNPGKHNTAHSGPDFKEACVQFDNLEFHGAIEVHVNSSDWYKHGHHRDAAYNSVVLHVVYQNDIQVVQNGFSIPTVELKEFIDEDHFKKFQRKLGYEISRPCSNSMSSVEPIYWSSMKTKALIQKLDEKVAPIRHLQDEEALYRLIAGVFGMGINKNAFMELAEILPWNALRELSSDKRRQLILVTSGCTQGDFSQKLGSEYQWHFKGTRPGNFPSVRIPQFANFISNLDLRKWIDFLLEGSSVVKSKERMVTLFSSQGMPTLSPSLRHAMCINAIAPFLYLWSERRKHERYLVLAIDLLCSLPSEKNVIIQKWKQNGIQSMNAFDSQGLIALNRYYCSLKKCLNCEVGLKVLGRE